MRVYLHTNEVPTEIFVLGDKLCHSPLEEYWIEPENEEESALVHAVVTTLAKEGIHTYRSAYYARKLEQIDGQWMETKRPVFIVQFKGKQHKIVGPIIKQLLEKKTK